MKKGLRLDPRTLQLEIVPLVEGSDAADLLVHDETNPVLANLLARLKPPFPVAMGVLYRAPRPTYETGVHGQIDLARSKAGAADLKKALGAGDTWEVK